MLTRANNEEFIRETAARLSASHRINFVYVDPPRWLTFWKRGRRGVHLYYLIWQLFALFRARSLNRELKFDLVHHVTFATVRQPSLLGLLGVPFVLGPIGGGERSPPLLRQRLSFFARLRERARDIVNLGTRLDPVSRLAFCKATRIYVTSTDTLAVLPRVYRSKAKLKLAIGIERDLLSNRQAPPFAGKTSDLLFVGQLVYLKGVHLAIQTLSRIAQHSQIRMTIAGSGPEEMNLRALAEALGVSHLITWIPWQNRRDVIKLYQAHRVFLFPSLRDSGGIVVLEALASGLPTVCLAAGGPGQIVDDQCGAAVSTTGQTELQVIEALATSTWRLLSDVSHYESCAAGAVSRALDFCWEVVADSVYDDISNEMGGGVPR